MAIFEPDQFYSTTELAKRLSLSIRAIQNWIESGEVKAYRFGRKFRVLGKDFEAFLEASRAEYIPRKSKEESKNI